MTTDTKKARGAKRRGLPYVLAERMGFEPMHRKTDDRISSAARYDHFDTSPYSVQFADSASFLSLFLSASLTLSSRKNAVSKPLHSSCRTSLLTST